MVYLSHQLIGSKIKTVMKENKIQIKITSRQIAVSEMMLDQVRRDLEEKGAEMSANEPLDDTLELSSAGVLRIDNGRVTVEYAETELTGMEGALTRLSFDRDNPGLVTMMREGTVETVLIFEQGRQHICAYQTPYMPFELCVRTFRVINELLESGFIYLDYTVEVRGARVERNKFTLEISAADASLDELLAHQTLPTLRSEEQ